MALVPVIWKEAIASIELQASSDEVRAGSPEFYQIGTGFCVSPDQEEPLRLLLMTNRHVIEQALAQDGRMFLRFLHSPRDEQGRVQRMAVDLREEDKDVRWFVHRNAEVDLAVLRGLGEVGLPHPPPACFGRHLVATPELVEQWEIRESEELFLISFYPTLIGGVPSSPIVRSALLASVEDSHSFVIECTVFPGNSGSPVFLKRTTERIRNQQLELGSAPPPLLLGVVFAYIPYRELAISVQTRMPRIQFEENSGLARCVTFQAIHELLDLVEPHMTPRDRVEPQTGVTE